MKYTKNIIMKSMNPRLNLLSRRGASHEHWYILSMIIHETKFKINCQALFDIHTFKLFKSRYANNINRYHYNPDLLIGVFANTA